MAHRVNLSATLTDAFTFDAPSEGGPNDTLQLIQQLTSVDGVYFAERTLTQNTSEDLDLDGATLEERDGTPLSLKTLQVLAIKNTGAGLLSITQEATNGVVGLYTGASEGQILATGGLYLWFDPTGLALTVGTGDLLTVSELNVDEGEYQVFVGGVRN